MAIKTKLAIIRNILETPFKFKIDYWLSISAPNKLSNHPLPWMNYNTIAYIEKTLMDGNHVFEYGSGSSTRYWINHGCKVTSIEHDILFYTELTKKIDGKCDYFLIPPTRIPSNNKNPESPDLFQSADLDGYSFENYVKSIDNFEDNFFDIVLIDGRARPSCIKRAIPKLKKNGKLILDNSDRIYYLSETSELLSDWLRVSFTGTVRGLLHHEQTTIFIKP
jgi:hypothetical protein